MKIEVKSEEEAQAAILALEKAIDTLSDLQSNPFHADVWNTNDGLDEDALAWARDALHQMERQWAFYRGQGGELAGGYQLGGYYD